MQFSRIILLSLIISTFFNTFSYAGTHTSCESFAKEIFDYTQKNISLSQKKEYLLKNVDTKFITKFVLGSNWRTLSADQRKEFYDVYSKYVVYKYTSYLGQYKLTGYKLNGVRPDSKRSDICNVDAVVTTKVKGESTEVPLTGVISTANQQFLMQDILFKNLSILQIQQQEISSMIKAEGFEKTITTLKEFVESQK